MKRILEVFTDGACSGNPGPAGIGVVLKENGQTVCEISKSIGEATNNIAEYTALVYALQKALILKATDLKISMDSELVYKQVTGQYKVKHPNMKVLFDQVRHLLEGFDHVEIKHVLREFNKEADKLATSALKKQTKAVAASFDHDGEESPSSKG